MIESDLGQIKCHHTHGRAPGEKVVFSIRSYGFERDSRGQIKGKIAKPTFIGDNTDACLKVKLPEGKDKEILVHIHPEENVSVGDEVCLKVIPYFVAVVDDKEKGQKNQTSPKIANLYVFCLPNTYQQPFLQPFFRPQAATPIGLINIKY